jgi:hypothetical protein
MGEIIYLLQPITLTKAMVLQNPIIELSEVKISHEGEFVRVTAEGWGGEISAEKLMRQGDETTLKLHVRVYDNAGKRIKK